MYKNCAKHVAYITNTKFNIKHSLIPISKTLEKSWILKTLKKESIFLYSKRQFFFQPTGVFTSLGMANFNDMSHFFFFSLYGSNVNSENLNEKIWLILCDFCYFAG